MRVFLFFLSLFAVTGWAQSIINIQPIPTPIPPCTTLVCKEAILQSQMLLAMNRTATQDARAFTALMNSVWNNPAFTPQQVFDGWGTQACQLFSTAAATATFLTTVDPSYVPPTPSQTFQINADCTVTSPSPTPTPTGGP